MDIFQLDCYRLKDEVIYAVAQTKDPGLIKATLKLTTEAEPRDILNFVHDFAENLQIRRPVLNWMFDNIDMVNSSCVSL